MFIMKKMNNYGVTSFKIVSVMLNNVSSSMESSDELVRHPPPGALDVSFVGVFSSNLIFLAVRKAENGGGGGGGGDINTYTTLI